MKIFASEGLVTFECVECGVIERIKPCNSKRTFQSLLNKFMRKHVWRCETKARSRKPMKPAEKHRRMLRATSTYGMTKQ